MVERGLEVGGVEQRARLERFRVRALPRSRAWAGACHKASSPVSPERQGKHPVAAANDKGQVLLVWAEGTSWNKGGEVAFQLYDAESTPLTEKGRAQGLKPWSLPTAFVERDGKFTIIY